MLPARPTPTGQLEENCPTASAGVHRGACSVIVLDNRVRRTTPKTRASATPVGRWIVEMSGVPAAQQRCAALTKIRRAARTVRVQRCLLQLLDTGARCIREPVRLHASRVRCSSVASIGEGRLIGGSQVRILPGASYVVSRRARAARRCASARRSTTAAATVLCEQLSGA